MLSEDDDHPMKVDFDVSCLIVKSGERFSDDIKRLMEMGRYDLVRLLCQLQD